MPDTDPVTVTTNLAIRIGARTDIGAKRSSNEDAVALLDLPNANAAFVLADGMGGLAAGDLAAQDTIRIFDETLTMNLADATADIDTVLRDAAFKANEIVYARAESKRSELLASKKPKDAYERKTGERTTNATADALMGSTVVAGIVRGDTIHLLHVGDSRAYIFGRDGNLRRLTHDHSFVEERVRAGDITEAEARKSRFRNMITRAIGIASTVTPEIQRFQLVPGDTFLACSDGLTTMLEDDEIAETLRDPQIAKRSPQQIAETLVEEANAVGGADNITVVIIQADNKNGSASLSANRPPVEKATVAPSVMPVANSGSSQPSRRMQQTASVLDIDNPVRRKRSGSTSGWLVNLFALIGILALISLMAIGLSDGLKRRIATILRPASNTTSSTTTTIPSTVQATPADLTNLAYAAPTPFGNRAARGDLLLYSPGVGLYFVGLTTNNMVALKPDGTPQANAVTKFPEQVSGNRAAHPYAASDTQGNVYIAQTARRAIEKFSPTGRLLKKITGLDGPEAVAVDEKGNIYVVDFSVVKIIRVKTAATSPPVSATTPAKKP